MVKGLPSQMNKNRELMVNNMNREDELARMFWGRKFCVGVRCYEMTYVCVYQSGRLQADMEKLRDEIMLGCLLLIMIVN